MSPCKSCQDRKLNCHSGCYRYLEYNLFDRSDTPKKQPYKVSSNAQLGCKKSRGVSGNKRKADTKKWLEGQNISYTEWVRNDVIVNCL